CLLALALMPSLVSAANISINDTFANETISVTWDNNFDAGGFCVNGVCAPSSAPGVLVIPEVSGPIHFNGGWISNGGTPAGSATFYWLEPGSSLLSDRLDLTWTSQGGPGPATIVGTFISDSETSLGFPPDSCPSALCFTLPETGNFQELAGIL